MMEHFYKREANKSESDQIRERIAKIEDEISASRSAEKKKILREKIQELEESLETSGEE